MTSGRRALLDASAALVAVVACLAAGLVAHPRREPPGAASRARFARAYLALPLAFERNEGQAPPDVAYLARGFGHVLAIAHGEARLSVAGATRATGASLRLQFAGANPDPEIRASEELAGRAHYLRGRDRARWHTDIPTYARVTVRELYRGVDLVFRGSGERLEYDFVLAPGAAPAAIRLRIDGVDSMAIDAAGDLHLRAGALDLVQRAPRTHQEAAGRRVEIPSRFALRSDREIGFEVADYDRERPLVIDPVLEFASYLGGAGADGFSGSELGEHLGIAVDASGCAVVAGETQSTDFPVLDAAQAEPGGGLDAFVTKLLPNGRGLVYSTYLGGSDDDGGHAVAVDAGGNAVVVGSTRSSDFPVLAAQQPVLGGGSDAFVAKLSPQGALLYSTFLGGSGDDAAAAVATDAQGNAHLAGATSSSDFPLRDALQATAGGAQDAFLARLAPGGALAYASRLGGTGDDGAEAIAVTSGGVFVAGATRSPDFPTHAPLQAALRGASDAFVTRVSPDGASLLYSTFLGGSDEDAARGLVVLPGGVGVAIGETRSPDFPTVAALQPLPGGGADAFLAGLTPSGGALVFATHLGGSGDETGTDVVAAGGSLFAAGTTASADFPTVAPMQATLAGEDDAWLARLGPGGTSLAFSTYLGGERKDAALALAAAPSGRVHVAGYTGSRLFPTFHALKSDLGVGSDAFVAAIDPATPAFAYSTYLGGNAEESSVLFGLGIAVDGTGHAYVTGPTLSPDLATSGALQPVLGGRSDALVAKLDADGAALEYATYLGGSGDDASLGIAVDAGGHACVTGRSDSPDFPVVGAAQPDEAGGFDAFVAKLTPHGDGLVYSTFLGGGGSDLARGIAVDGAGAAVVAGATSSADFPVRNALQPERAGGLDAFVSRLAPSGALEWSTYLGGSRDEMHQHDLGIALDAAGNVLVAGTTESADFPLVLPIQATFGQSRDAYVARIAADGSHLLFATYLGGSGGDTARDVATDAFGRIYVVGATRSPEFPVVNAIQPLHNDPLWYDAFVARIGPGPSGPVLDFSTFLGGSLLDGALAVDVDPAGNIHVAGQTTSPDFPIVNGFGSAGAGNDGFWTVLPAAGDRVAHSVRIGGGDDDIALGLATDAAGSAYLTGITESLDFPTVAPFQAAPGGAADAFVAKLALGPGAFACEIATDQSSYAVGQLVRVTQLRFANAGPLPLRARLRIDLEVPELGTLDLLRTTLTLPADLDANLAPFPLFAVDAAKPPGAWRLGCAVDDPATGVPIARQSAAFSVH